MNKCPKCQQEIDHLLCQQYDLVVYQFDGGDYTETDREADTITEPVYLCPWCEAEVARGEAEARKILGLRGYLVTVTQTFEVNARDEEEAISMASNCVRESKPGDYVFDAKEMSVTEEG